MEAKLKDITQEILKETNDVELIFVSGSYAFGRMQRYSDIDLKVLTRTTPPKREYVSRFIKERRRNILLTIHFYTLSHLLRKIRRPEEWVWAYMSYGQAKVFFDRNQNMDKIKRELEKHKAPRRDFLKFVPLNASYLLEYVGKLKNAHLDKDELSILYVARSIAEICYNILRPFSPIWKYSSEKEIYRSFLELHNAPEHYVEDFKTCYGLTMKRRTINDTYKSAIRLAQETVDFLRKNKIEAITHDKEFWHFFNSKEYMDFLK